MTHHSQLNIDVDIGLAVLEVVAKKLGLTQVQLSAKDIADVCGCSHQLISSTEHRARRKVAQQISPEWVQL
jgi:transcriptional regulator with XRE-family HTH domain